MKLFLRCAAMGALSLAAQAADFSYYMLSLSYTPSFCAQPSGKKDPRECGSGRKAFVVHGLWPQNEDGHGPTRCAPARPVGTETVRGILGYMPTESLIQHEWATHGTCSGLSPKDYFAAVQRTRDSIRIPPGLETLNRTVVLSPAALEGEFRRENPGVPRDGFRVACYSDGAFEEIRICFDKNWNARACTGASECTKQAVRLPPVINKR